MASTKIRFFDDVLRRRLASAGLRSCEDFAAFTGGALVAETRTSRTRRLVLEDGGSLFLKQYLYSDSRPRSALRRHKGRIEARNYRCLRLRCGVAVPDVIAIGSRRAGWRLLDAFILTRGLENTQPLDRWWSADPAEASRVWRDHLRLSSVATVARMHRAGFFHIDLQWRNVLVRPPRRPGAAAELFVIDSSRGGRRWSPWMKRHARLRDLSSLEKSARGRLPLVARVRWLRDYLAVLDLREEWRPWVRRIANDRARKDAP